MRDYIVRVAQSELRKSISLHSVADIRMVAQSSRGGRLVSYLPSHAGW